MVELYDELYSGVFSVGAAAIQTSLDVSHQGLIGVLLVAPMVGGVVLEPWLLLLADRWPRRGFIAGGLGVMALASLGCALAPSAALFGVAVAISALANTCGVELAQATLVDARPDERERVMTRWVFFGAVGDLLAPVLLVVLAVAGLGWRAGFVVMAVLLGLWAVLVARAPFPPRLAAPDEADDADPGLFTGLRLALGNRRLLPWLLATWMCDLLDELLVILAAVHLRDQLGAGEVARSVVIGAGVIGGLAMLWALERLLVARTPRSILVVSSVACVAALAAWIAAPGVVWSALLFALLGAATAPLFPLTMAQAYAALPGRSGAVQAASRVLTPLSLVTPWGFAWLADRGGTTVALAAVAVGPLVILVVALAVPPAPPATIAR